ncbi:MAG: hypothetical protein MZV70_35060 [Desulfobacterales bacterium]|nr:hypothetical protein [Desulfobacterales bacterium]
MTPGRASRTWVDLGIALDLEDVLEDPQGQAQREGQEGGEPEGDQN